MSDLRKAAQQALEALEKTIVNPMRLDAITNLRAALAQQAEPAQEPVAWMNPDDGRVIPAQTMQHAREGGGASLSSVRSYTVALGPIRAQRPPLTDEEIWQVYYDLPESDFEGSDRIAFARAIERKVRGE